MDTLEQELAALRTPQALLVKKTTPAITPDVEVVDKATAILTKRAALKKLDAAQATAVNREAWLNLVADRMAPWFTDLGAPLPPFRLSIGFTSSKKAIGVCFTDAASADAHHEVFIHPRMADSLEVAAILAHELAHAAAGIKAGHGPAFGRLARAIGLDGKLTATTAGPDFMDRVAPILEDLGPIPHASLDPAKAATSGPKKQGTRMVKCTCLECGYVVRTTKKWLVDVGAPHCPKHGPMATDLPADELDDVNQDREDGLDED